MLQSTIPMRGYNRGSRQMKSIVRTLFFLAMAGANGERQPYVLTVMGGSLLRLTSNSLCGPRSRIHPRGGSDLALGGGNEGRALLWWLFVELRLPSACRIHANWLALSATGIPMSQKFYHYQVSPQSGTSVKETMVGLMSLNIESVFNSPKTNSAWEIMRPLPGQVGIATTNVAAQPFSRYLRYQAEPLNSQLLHFFSSGGAGSLVAFRS